MKALKRIGITLLVLFVIYGAYIAGFTLGRVEPQIATDNQTSFLTEVNRVRAAKELPALVEDQSLNATALIKANDMAAKNYFEHNAPDGTPWYTFIQNNRPGSDRVGENLGMCFASNVDTIFAWIKSEAHYKNMLEPDWTKFGTATVWDADQGCNITVNHFSK